MTRQNIAGALNLSEEMLGLPEKGPQTVTFWAGRCGQSRKLFVSKLKLLGIEPDPLMHTVLAEELYAAIERYKRERQRKTSPQPE